MLQREDLPKDIENPLYDYGFGMKWPHSVNKH